MDTILNALKTFLYLFGELFLLFIGISFLVALLQIYITIIYKNINRYFKLKLSVNVFVFL